MSFRKYLLGVLLLVPGLAGAERIDDPEVIDQLLADMIDGDFALECERPTVIPDSDPALDPHGDDNLDKVFGARIYRSADFGKKNYMEYRKRYKFDERTAVRSPCEGTIIRIERDKGWLVILHPVAFVYGGRPYHTSVLQDIEIPATLELGTFVEAGEVVGYTGSKNRFRWSYLQHPDAASTPLITDSLRRHPDLLMSARYLPSTRPQDPPVIDPHEIGFDANYTTMCQLEVDFEIPKASTGLAAVDIEMAIEGTEEPARYHFNYNTQEKVPGKKQRVYEELDADGNVIERITFNPHYFNRDRDVYELNVCFFRVNSGRSTDYHVDYKITKGSGEVQRGRDRLY